MSRSHHLKGQRSLNNHTNMKVVLDSMDSKLNAELCRTTLNNTGELCMLHSLHMLPFSHYIIIIVIS